MGFLLFFCKIDIIAVFRWYYALSFAVIADRSTIRAATVKVFDTAVQKLLELIKFGLRAFIR